MIRLRNIFFAFFLFAFCKGESCFFEIEGEKYNLAPLTNTNADYSVVSGEYTFFINFCTPIVTPACGAGMFSGCQTWNNGKKVIGSATSVTAAAIPKKKGKGLILVYPPAKGLPKNMEVEFICTKNANPGTLKYLGEENSMYRFEYDSEYACPINKGGISGGSVFLIILFVCSIVYLIAGIIFNKVKNQATGKALIPQVDFWLSIPFLVKDGIFLIINKIRGRSAYTQI